MIRQILISYHMIDKDGDYEVGQEWVNEIDAGSHLVTALFCGQTAIVKDLRYYDTQKHIVIDAYTGDPKRNEK